MRSASAMRVSLRFIISALSIGMLLAACAGGGSSGTHSSGAAPLTPQSIAAAGEAQPAVRSRSDVRRTSAAGGCTGTGMNAFVGGGTANLAGGLDSFIIDGYQNTVCDDTSGIAGGSYNKIASGGGGGGGFIGTGNINTLGYGESNSAIVAGDGNEVDAQNAAIVDGISNTTSAEESLIGGGYRNTINSGGTYSAIGSGYENTLSGQYAFLGAGTYNTVSGEGAYVAAGGYNTASGTGAVVDGGFNSTAAGTFATIPGGYVNSAAGTYSFAAGARAKAAQTGTFVWSDGSDGDAILTSSRAYQFLARASGGFTLYTNAASTVGAQLAAGSGTWASLSDRNVKTNIAPADDAAVLDKVAALPISRWSYKSEHGVRHVGPMAQDFYAAFKVGPDDKHITSIDEDGVALAAIKALHAENARLRAQLESTNARLASTDARLMRLTAVVAAMRRN